MCTGLNCRVFVPVTRDYINEFPIQPTKDLLKLSPDTYGTFTPALEISRLRLGWQVTQAVQVFSSQGA